MVSHNGEEFTFGDGEGEQTQLLKMYFKIEDVVDDFSPRSFRIPTYYEGGEGYYTYVSDDYLLDYQVWIDGNYGTDSTDQGGARGDITLHPKLVDVEGYFRYVQGNNLDGDNTYPYWKVRFELDQSNPDEYNSWYNIEDIDDESLTDESTIDSDDVIGDTESTFWFDNKGTTQHQNLPGEGFLGVSYYDSTYTDDRGYYNIQLPRNNVYRMSFYPPDASDDIGDHEQLEMDRYAITNINDAIASFNFQSNKHKDFAEIDTLNAVEYFIGDVDGDDVFQLNDSYFLWAYTSGILDKYEHLNGDTLQSWASIDTLRENGEPFPYEYYENWGNQRYEFTIFYDDDFDQDTELQFGQIETINPLMNTIQTGLDTIQVGFGAGSSTYQNDAEVDYTIDSLAYFFTGDINATGTKVKENEAQPADATSFDTEDGYIDVNGSTYYRWGNNPPNTWANKILATTPDVFFSLPADSTVKVKSGDLIEVPLTITPEQVNVAGFEFEVEFNTNELEFIDMQTGTLPGPWFTYVNVHEKDEIGYQKVSFGGMDYSPGNSPQNYWIDNEMLALKLVFRADFPDSEWTQAPINFVGKHAAGNPSGKDLLVGRESGRIWVWNKYWAFGGGEPEEDEITYNYPNPFKENTRFQFYVDELERVKLYILNANGQYVGTLLNEDVEPGIHTFDFSNEPTIWLPQDGETSVYQEHQTLEPGVYVFVLQTEKRIKANKFTVVK